VTVLIAFVVGSLILILILLWLHIAIRFETEKDGVLKRMTLGLPIFVMVAIDSWMIQRRQDRRGKLFGKKLIGPRWGIYSSPESLTRKEKKKLIHESDYWNDPRL
jgi:hypothetical protein